MNKADVIAYFHQHANPDGLPATAATAAAMGITRQAVEKWPDPIPELTAYKVQVLSKGRIQVDPLVYRRQRESRRADS